MVNFTELSLHGSQICLATRGEPAKAPPIFYPPQNSRPNSALNINRNRLSVRNTNGGFRRPLSADSRFINNNLKEHHRVKFDLENKTANTSSNIYKLMVQEPVISKYWTSNGKLRPKIKKPEPIITGEYCDSSTSCGESIEEDIPTVKIDQKSKEEIIMNGSPKFSEKVEELKKKAKSEQMGVKTFPQKSRPPALKLNFDMGMKTLNGIHQKNGAKVAVDTKTTYDLWVNENIKTKNKNLDLPGRVSFSTNDVFEIDYSDYEETESNHSHNYDKSIYLSPTNGESIVAKQYVKESYMESNSDNEVDDANLGPELEENSEQKLASSPKSHIEVNQIIEDYKKEIASINHRREMERKIFIDKESIEAPAELFKPSKLNIETEFEKFEESFTSFQGDALKKHFLHTDEDEVDGKFFNIDSSSKNVIQNYYDTVMDIKTENSSKNQIKSGETKLNNVKEQEAKEKNRIESTSLKNFLKPKDSDHDKLNIRPVSSLKKFNDLSKKKHTVKSQRSHSANSNKNNKTSGSVSSQNSDKPKKQKSPRDDSNLSEFQIEKVTSWMTVNEDTFSEFEYSEAAQASNAGKSSGILRKNSDWKADEKSGEAADSTYADIVSIIKEIEDNKQDKSDFKLLKTDVEFKLNTILNSIELDDDPSTTETSEDPHDKLKEIFCFLDKVDSNCDQALINSKCIAPEGEHHELEFALEPDVIEDVPKIADLLILPNHQLARRIVKLSLRANELSNAIQLSKEHVSNVRSDKLKSIRLEKLSGQNRLKDQKKHYEDIVARHQAFIEQLIKDKAGLCDKVTQISRRMDSQNQAWEHRLKTETERAKETANAGEKIRRERWVRENTKKIKELTVKGLENEINKMNSSNNKEIEDLKRQHQIDIITAIEETKSKFEKVERNIRDSYAEEREGAIDRERKAIKERYEKQMEDERNSFEQQRLRMINDFETDKDRLYVEIRDKEHQFEMKKEEMIHEKLELLDDTKTTFKEKLKQRDIKHQNDLTKLQEQYETDFSIWKREHEAMMKLRETEREHAIRDQYKSERDRQIDVIVSKVDAETIKNQQDYDIKINRLKDKYEHEIRDLESSEKGLKQKYIDTRTRLAEIEANAQNLQATVKQMEAQISHSNKLLEEFTREKETIKDDTRSEIKNELKSMQNDHQSEIQRIYSRVQQAIHKKDATLEIIQKENNILKERCLKLDSIIRQQRKDYCTK